MNLKPTSNKDEIVISSVKKEMNKDGFDHFELVSITSLEIPHITSVIVRAGYAEIVMDVESKTGKIIHKERLAR